MAHFLAIRLTTFLALWRYKLGIIPMIGDGAAAFHALHGVQW